MRKKKILALKRAIGFKGRLSVVEKSLFRAIKKGYHKLNHNERLQYVDLIYKEGAGKSQEVKI